MLIFVVRFRSETNNTGTIQPKLAKIAYVGLDHCSPSGEPNNTRSTPGITPIRPNVGQRYVILDPSASRYHAKVVYESETEQITAHDLESTNGTFVNRDRLTTPRRLQVNDVIRIGQHMMELSYFDEQVKHNLFPSHHNTQQLNPDLILESLDQHAILLSEVASRLNTILRPGDRLTRSVHDDENSHGRRPL